MMRCPASPPDNNAATRAEERVWSRFGVVRQFPPWEGTSVGRTVEREASMTRIGREHRKGSHKGALQPAAAISLTEPLLDVQAAAELLNVKVSWIREATRTGLLPCIKVGRQVRWTKPMLEQWLAEHRSDG